MGEKEKIKTQFKEGFKRLLDVNLLINWGDYYNDSREAIDHIIKNDNLIEEKDTLTFLRWYWSKVKRDLNQKRKENPNLNWQDLTPNSKDIYIYAKEYTKEFLEWKRELDEIPFYQPEAKELFHFLNDNWKNPDKMKYSYIYALMEEKKFDLPEKSKYEKYVSKLYGSKLRVEPDKCTNQKRQEEVENLLNLYYSSLP